MGMAMKVSALCISILAVLFSQSLATFPSSPLHSDFICQNTSHSDFCIYILPSNKSHSIFYYANLSIHQSLLNARSFLASVDRFLALPSTSTSNRTIQALEDCRFLANHSLDFLSQISIGINSKDGIKSGVADDLHALLSAALTNLETCFEGLEAVPLASRIKDRLFQSNATKSVSVSLAIFRHWGPGSTKPGGSRRFPHMRRNSPLSLLMSTNKQVIYEFATGKKNIRILTNGQVSVKHVVMVSPKGGGQFRTINAAIAAAPNNLGNTDQYYVIYVAAGVYQEYISIPMNKQNLVLIGDGIGRTIITGSRSVPDGLTTFNTATFGKVQISFKSCVPKFTFYRLICNSPATAVAGKKFIAVDITFRNTAGPRKGQAVAVRNGADQSVFYRCSIEGYQDTLYVNAFRQFYKECDIYGTVDFIFGDAAVVFQNCNIYTRRPLPGQYCTITAQGRGNPNEKTGYVIDNCVVKAAYGLASSKGMKKTYLGRPWKKYSRTVYVQSFMDSSIDPSGWIKWNGAFDSSVYYAEYGNKGPGSNTGFRINWPGYHNHLNNYEVNQYTVSNFIDGGKWLPATGVPFTASFH
ncbi:hypothetical protein V6N13_052169 [Hibiscus sabdariffa]|uniref:Pectinesterase n=2 Tax=Hibiscus sabdariffa TaxID=183260 RepID=A0ABR2A6D6_9ROSI